MSDNDAIAANLAQLYHDGKTTLPNVGGRFGSAKRALAGGEVTTEFNRSSQLSGASCATGEGSGPKASFNAVAQAIMSACQRNEKTLELIGDNLVATVQDFVKLNEELAAVYKKDGGKLRG